MRKIVLSLLLLGFFSAKAQLDSAMVQPELIGINSDRPGFSLNPQNPGHKNTYLILGFGTGSSELYRYDFNSNGYLGTFGIRHGLLSNWEIGGYYLANRDDYELKGVIDSTFEQTSHTWNIQTRFRFLNTNKSVLTGYADYVYSGGNTASLGLLYALSVSDHFSITMNGIYSQPFELENNSNFLYTLNLAFPFYDDFGFFIEGVGNTGTNEYFTDIGIWFLSSNHFLWDLAYTQGFNNDILSWNVDLGVTYSFGK